MQKLITLVLVNVITEYIIIINHKHNNIYVREHVKEHM